MRLRIAILILLTSVGPLWADQAIQNVQQALKDQGFYYGEITGTKDADTTAAIRRYQIRNGLQITGDLNAETLKSLGVDSSGARAIAKASPSPVPTAPDSSDLGAEPRESAAGSAQCDYFSSKYSGATRTLSRRDRRKRRLRFGIFVACLSGAGPASRYRSTRLGNAGRA